MVHGAYQEGIRAAQDCIEHFRQHQRQTLRNADDSFVHNRSVSVVVIGAGATGLAAARHLIDHHTNQSKTNDGKEDTPQPSVVKFQVIVVEARNRIGGRVRTETLSSDNNTEIAFATTAASSDAGEKIVVELGANWLQQGDRDNPLVPLAVETLGLETRHTDFLRPMEYPSSRYVPPDRVDAIMNEFARRCQNQVGRYATEKQQQQQQQKNWDPSSTDFSIAPRSAQDVYDEWIHDITTRKDDPITTIITPEEIRHVLEGELLCDAGVPLSHLSAAFGMEPGVGEGDRWVVGGYHQILHHLARDLDIRYEWVVESVETTYGQSSAEPRCIAVVTRRRIHDRSVDAATASDSLLPQQQQQQLCADAVICTVPCSVLQRSSDEEGSIQFIPPISDSHVAALQALTTGKVEKVALQFSERWWPPALDSYGYLRVYGDHFGDVSEWLDCTDVYGVPVISGLFSGPWLEEIWSDGATDQEIATKATAALFKAIHET
jgi:monoamine oxidase